MKKQDSVMSQTMKNVFLNRQMVLPGKIICLICLAVIPLLVFCPSSWALDKSSLNGTFISGEFESGFHGADINEGWGANDEVILLRTETTFDGAGNFTMTTYEYKFVRNIGETGSPPSNQFETTYTEESGVTDSGTYTVSPDGEVTMNFVGEDTGTGYLSEDGRTLVFGWSEFEGDEKWCDMGIGVGIKRGSGFTEASLDGTYVFSEFESGFHGGDPGNWGANDEQYWIRTEIVFDGIGGFTLTGHEYKINREILEILVSGTTPSNKFSTTAEDSGVTDSGTYTVSSDGEVTMNFVGGDTGTAYVGEGAQTAIFGWVDFDNDNQNCAMGLGMGVKKGSGFTNASVKGTYTVGLFESDFYGPDSYGGWGANDGQELDKEKFIFDGAGNFKVVSDEYDMERNIGEVSGGGGYSNKFTTTYTEQLNESGTGTYTVSNEGVLTLNFAGGDTGIAYLSADGKTMVTGWSEYSNGPSEYYGSTGIGFGVKVPKVNKGLPAIYLLLLGD